MSNATYTFTTYSDGQPDAVYTNLTEEQAASLFRAAMYGGEAVETEPMRRAGELRAPVSAPAFSELAQAA